MTRRYTIYRPAVATAAAKAMPAGAVFVADATARLGNHVRGSWHRAASFAAAASNAAIERDEARSQAIVHGRDLVELGELHWTPARGWHVAELNDAGATYMQQIDQGARRVAL